MDLQTLLQKRDAAERRFNELRDQKALLETEMVKLQGEFRVLEDLIAGAPAEDTAQDAAATIVAETTEVVDKPKDEE